MKGEEFLSVLALKSQGETMDIKKTVNCGDLCIFNRVNDSSKCLVGRITQLSYLTGNKRERQYSSELVDMEKPSFKAIGVFANWFQGLTYAEGEDMVKFKPLEFFHGI